MKVFNIKALAHFGIFAACASAAHYSEVLFNISHSWAALIFALQVPAHMCLSGTKLMVLNKTNVPVYYGTTNDGQHCLDCRERGWVLHTNTATELYKFKVQSPYILGKVRTSP